MAIETIVEGWIRGVNKYGAVKVSSKAKQGNEEKTVSLVLYTLSWIGRKGLHCFGRELEINKETHMDNSKQTSICYVVSPVLVTGDTAVKLSDLVLVLIHLTIDPHHCHL